MTDMFYTVPPETVQKIRSWEIDRLPYGILEITPDGAIVDYIPLRLQISIEEFSQIHGLNLFEEIIPCELSHVFRRVIANLENNADRSERLLITLAFSERVVRIAVVAMVAASRTRIRISLIRQPSIQPKYAARTRRLLSQSRPR